VRAGWIAGVAIVLGLGYITLNTLRTEGQGGKGVPPGAPLPPFAAPLAVSALKGDANVAVAAQDGRPAACDVRGPDVVNSCQMVQRGPAVIAFFITRSERCHRQIDVLDRLRERFPHVSFAAVAIRGDRDDVRAAVRDRRWRLPVAWDHDGAVANAYAVSVCPTLVLARRGGKVLESLIGERDEATLARAVGRLGS
jgi:hypothetical protein